jgi:hypothetical protein
MKRYLNQEVSVEPGDSEVAERFDGARRSTVSEFTMTELSTLAATPAQDKTTLVLLQSYVILSNMPHTLHLMHAT